MQRDRRGVDPAKGRHEVTDCEVKLTSERREEAPRLFTHINLHFIVTGKELKDAAVSRAVDLSAEKYCSVALMLEKAVKSPIRMK